VRADLSLSYVQVGLLLAVPSILAHLIEPVFGLLGDGRHRRALIRGGGVAFAAALALIALGGGFWALLAALVLLYPASGALVGLSQATLADAHAEEGGHERGMAWWALAGWIGALAGPLLVGLAASAAFGWRGVVALLAAAAVPVVALVWRLPMAAPPEADADRATVAVVREGAREAWRALRRREVWRLLALLEVANLLLDVLLAYLALYLVDVARASDAQAGLAVGVWTGAGLLGSTLLIPLLDRVSGERYVRASALAALVVFPAFLLVEALPARLALLAVLGLLTAGWYPVLQGRLYATMPGRSASVLTLCNVSGLVAALVPLGLGVVAERVGLGTTLWLLAVAPAVLLAGLPRDVASRSDGPVDGDDDAG
jgi:FSR family fosmidomycin resistance protein-like MFS transporter